ncbi:thioredoxin domain-containing protein [Corynebacterium sp. H128]|uniref:thioredoxin domain-containing protein n=1 Tax=unclassified Corynebacterium TaxID=2624378 RepID=UPI00309ECCDC
MSNKIKSPNEKSNGFLWALLTILLIAVVVVGYIFWSGKSSKIENVTEEVPQTQVSFDMEMKDNAYVLKSDKATDATPQVDLYEDFSCPHCSELATATDKQMVEAVDAGKLIVNVRTLNFLDGGNADGHSTRAGNALMMVAQSEDASTYWNYRDLLMQKQKDIYSKWNMADFAEAARKVGASEDTATKIAEAPADHADAVAMFKANEEKLKTETGKVSSPRIIKDGKDIDDLQNWVEVATS